MTRRYLTPLLAALFLLAAAACDDNPPPATPTAATEPPVASATTAASTTPAPAATPTVRPTPRPVPGARDFPDDSAAELQALFDQTIELRGLSLDNEVPSKLISRGDAANYIESTLDEEDLEFYALKQDVYELLGLIPAESDLLDQQISLLRQLILGFYDPDIKTLFVIDDLGVSSPTARSTIVHEIVHGIQDAHYDLNATFDAIPDGDWDAEMAYTALIEGDARSTENRYAFPGQEDYCDDSSFLVLRSSSIPPVIQRELSTPYTDGLCFVRTAAPGPPSAAAVLFANPPTTTEQILHPDVYLAGETAAPPELPSLLGDLGSGWQERDRGNFGEFSLQNYLLLGLSDVETVKRAAAGWGGDAWALYERGDDLLIEVGIVWDSQADADEFWFALVDSVNVRSGDGLGADPFASALGWESGGTTLRAGLDGNRVTLLVSTDAAASAAAASARSLP